MSTNDVKMLFIVFAVFLSCGIPPRPTCEEISETTYKIDIQRLAPDDQSSVIEAWNILSRDLHTKYYVVHSCDGMNPCTRYEYTPECSNCEIVATYLGYATQVRKNAFLNKNMAIAVFTHEAIHMIHEDEYFGRLNIHDSDPTSLMSRNYHGGGQPFIGLTEHDVKFVCGTL